MFRKTSVLVAALLWGLYPTAGITQTSSVAKPPKVTTHHTSTVHKTSHHTPKHHHSTHHHKKTTKPADSGLAPETTPVPINGPSSSGLSSNADLDSDNSSSWTHSVKQRFASLTSLASKTVENLRYSRYRYGGSHFDTQKGVYQVDCSHYVDNLLTRTNPDAYGKLADWSGSAKPSSEHYYDFFTSISDEPGYLWRRVSSGQQLQPGDILVFRYKNSRGHSAGGHVMVVMDKTVVEDNVVAVRVADSAAAGHSHDTRSGRKSGVGIGTLLLKVNDSGKPYAYAWRTDAPFRSNVSIAMGRPQAT